MQFRGADGPLKVNAIRSTYPILDRLMESAQSLQFPINADYNGQTQEGFGYYQLTQSHGLRFSAKKAYLAPVRRRSNLTVLTKCQVIGLDIDHNKTARGVHVLRSGRRQNLQATREVILSAGAIFEMSHGRPCPWAQTFRRSQRLRERKKKSEWKTIWRFFAKSQTQLMTVLDRYWRSN